MIFGGPACTREGCLSLKRKQRGSDRPGGALPPSLCREAGTRGRASSALGAPSRAGVDGPPSRDECGCGAGVGV